MLLYLNYTNHITKQHDTVKATYKYLADGTKLSVTADSVISSGSISSISVYGFDYLGSMVYSRENYSITLESTGFGDGRINKTNNSYDINYFITDHLGSTRAIVNANGSILEQKDYYLFGKEHENANLMSSTNRWGYNGKEKQTVGNLNYLDYINRMYDPEIGRWFVQDPLQEKHYNYSPYAYVYNNPMRYIDPFGLDSVQRIQAVTLAHEYVAKNSGDSYPTSQDKSEDKFRGKPGEKVDCSGMADNCMVAGGEPSSKNNGQNKGVANILIQSEKIGDKDDLSKAEVGNFVTLNNTRTEPLDSERDYNHIGIITQIERDDNGNVVTMQIAHSSGTPGSGKSGPHYDNAIIKGENKYWGKRITGLYKWDTKPDKK
jgi:RHS repeat-associated protein